MTSEGLGCSPLDATAAGSPAPRAGAPAAELVPRILMVTPGYPPTVGGAEMQCASLSEILAARGHRVRVVTRGREGCPRHETRAGVTIDRSRWWGRVPRPLARWLHAASFMVHVATAVRQAAREGGWLVHHHGLGMTLVAARLARRGRSVPMLAKVLGAGPGGECSRLSRYRRFWPLRRTLPSVDRFVAVTPRLMDELGGLGIGARRVTLLPNGVALPDAWGTETPGRTVFFGGRLDPIKDLPTLVEAWSSVVEEVPDARLTIAGDGPERPRLERRIAELGVGATVELPGFIPDYRAILACCAVFVLPSRSEGMSNALLEAMAAGRACVVSDVVENRQTLGEAGRYFPVGDRGALAAMLVALLESPAERVRLGRAARARVESEFSFESVANRYQRLYAELCALE